MTVGPYRRWFQIALPALAVALGCAKSPTGSDDEQPGDPGNPPGSPPPLAQAGAWMWANPTPQGSPVWRIRFASAEVAYAISEGGAVLRSTDAGASWEVAYKAFETQVQPHEALYGLYFLDGSRGWVVGESGRISSTVDGGATWIDRSISTTRDIRDVHFRDATNGIVVGENGVIYRTDDGGATWTSVDNPAGTSRLNVVTFPSADVGWIGGDDSTILYSDDGGATWSVVSITGTHDITSGCPMTGDGVAFGTDQGGVLTMSSPVDWTFPLGRDIVLDVQFTDADNGTVLYYEGNDYFLGVRVNGVWTHHPLSTTQSLNTVARRGQHVVVGGWWGVMQHSADGGMTWQSASGLLDNANPHATQLFDVAFDGDLGIAVGTAGAILRSADGGVTWSVRSSGVTEDLVGARITKDGTAFVVGTNGTAIRSTDGGLTWNDMPVSSAPNPSYLALSMWDAANGIIVGGLNADGSESILVTDDGGDSWMSWDRGAGVGDRTPFFAVWAGGSGEAWLGGRNGVVAHTDDGGVTWDALDTGSVRAIQSLQFVDDLHGWGATRTQEIVTTTDGGLTWNRVTLGSGIWDIQFGSTDVGIAVGTTGYAWGSVDGGLTWTLQDVGYSGWGHIRAAWMFSPTNGVIVGTESKIQYTRSAGFAP